MNTGSITKRLEAVTAELGDIYESSLLETYYAIEKETLKQVAIDAGIDHNRESTAVVQELGMWLQRERDVNRELRRYIAALENN